MEKVCTGCKTPRPIALFGKSASAKDKLQNWCNPCHNEANKNRYKADPAKYRKRQKDRRSKNPTEAKGYILKNKYKISLSDYNKMLAAQGGVCKICKQPELAISHKNGEAMQLAVDHCHETGTVRGLLCCNCNRGIGLFKDNQDLLIEAANYLKGTK